MARRQSPSSAGDGPSLPALRHVEEAALREAVASLAALDLAGVRVQWRNVFRGVELASAMGARGKRSRANKTGRPSRRCSSRGSQRRSPLARRTPGRSFPDHRVARHPRGQKRALDPNDAAPCVLGPRSGGRRDGGSASAWVLHQAPDRPADALVRAMGQDRTAGAGSGSSRTPLIHPAPFRAPRILLVVIGRRSASAPASPSRGPGNGILWAETGGRFQAQNAGERPEFGSQTANCCAISTERLPAPY